MTLETCAAKKPDEFLAGYRALARKRRAVKVSAPEVKPEPLPAAFKLLPKNWVCEAIQTLDEGEYRVVNAQELRHQVAIVFGVTVPELLSRYAYRRIVDARHCYCWLAVRHTKFSKARIGRMLDRDHSTVQHAIERFEDIQAQFEAELKLLDKWISQRFSYGANHQSDNLAA